MNQPLKNAQKPDEQAIRNLSLQEVVSALNLLEADPSRPDRYRPVGYNGSYWISCDWHGNVWNSFKHNQGGTPIDLVMACASGAPDYAINSRDFPAALKTLATAFGLWEVSPYKRGMTLASRTPQRENENNYDWLERQVECLEEGGLIDSWAEATRLFECLGVDPEDVTINPYRDALCWQPACPWQGMRISRDDITIKKGPRAGQTFRGFAGWTKDRLAAHWQMPGAGEIFVIDLDGNYVPPVPAGQPKVPQVPPRHDLVMALYRQLKRIGLEPAALVWSTPGEERSKAHLYFRTLHRAVTEEDYVANVATVAGIIESEVAKLGARGTWPAEEVDRMYVDTCTEQTTRLIRLPGFLKYGRDAAGVIGELSGHRIDLTDYRETQEQIVVLREKPLHTIRFGEGYCYEKKERAAKENGEITYLTIPVGFNLFPIAAYEVVDEEESGVLLRYTSKKGETKYTRVSANGFTDSSGAKRVAGAAALEGVNIATGNGVEWAYALGRWYNQKDIEFLSLVTRAGWYREAQGWSYVNGARVHGVQSVKPDPSSGTFRTRGHHRGTLEGWQAGMGEVFSTRGLCASLGASLAGALLKRLGRQGFILNICGDSSAGKTKALKLGACVWGNVEHQIHSWDSTKNALEALAYGASDACLCLDELQRFLTHAGGAEVSRAIHSLAGTSGRARLNKNAQLKAVRRWTASVLSSSETPIRDLVGDSWRGGDGVRALDLEIAVGDLTEDAAHAEMVDRFAFEHGGVAGDIFASFLVGIDDAHLNSRFDQWHAALTEGLEAGAEFGRVLGHIAAIALALEIAVECGLIPRSTPIAEHMEWVRRLIRASRRGLEDPNTRLLSLLIEHLQRHPGFFPEEGSGETQRERYGIRAGGTDALWTTESMLKAGPLCGQSVRSFLRWCEANDVAVRKRNARVEGLQTSWWLFDLEACANFLDVTLQSATATASATQTATGGQAHE